ncbi:DUF2267 domain-containing protein [Streptomyces sp. B6B3]|uniref:DUF2267 domain-containing protein n=1 Tax=Streptomyces sp. B6B3 TaxID=3153570 RepID=UPI00325CE1DE
MQHDELIGKVQAVAQLPDRGSAEQAARAVLRTLAERIPPGTAAHLAAQLPTGLDASVRGSTAAEERAGLPPAQAERFDLVAFAGRVAGRLGTTEDAAVQRSTAVLEVLDAAVAPELMTKVAHELPPDIRELFPTRRANGLGR